MIKRIYTLLLINSFGCFYHPNNAFTSISHRCPSRSRCRSRQTPNLHMSPEHRPSKRFVSNPTLSSPSKESTSFQRRDIIRLIVPIYLLSQSTTPLPAIARAPAAPTKDSFAEKVKTLTPTEAKARLSEAQTSLTYLLDHYDEIAEGGGDNVRRYIGTVGTSSGMYGIGKVMKVLRDEATDVVEFTETMNEINACINGADGSAYMAIFVTSSTSQTPPQKYFDDAKIEVKRLKKALDDLAKLVEV